MLGFEVMELRQVLSACPAVYAAPTLLHSLGANGASAMATAGPTGYSPAQIRHAYGFDAVSFTGAGTTIAIVDAYDDPNIANDLKQFDLKFGLADPVFRKVNQNGGTTMPATDAGWASEIALDVEWAHAIAPGASILLVEAKSNSMTDLMTAVNYARNQSGVVAVSMSWGGGEFSGETTYDSYFTTPSGHAGVSFFASSGDAGAPASYPAVSPNVVSVGGTALSLSSGNYSSESGWSGSGGGISSYESQPSYQSGVVTQSTTRRANPDVAYDSAPATGFPVYDSYNNGTSAPWSQFGGTSAAAPQWAALAALVAQGRAAAGLGPLDGRSQLLPALYQVSAADFHDVTSGTSTGSPSYTAAAGYDLVTGRGTPVANLLVADLVVWGTTSPPTPTPSAPTAPSGFTASGISTTQIGLSWGASTGADGYQLYLVSGGTATLIGSYSAATTSATVGGLTAATTYSFRLDAYNTVGTASATAQATTLAAASIAAPTNLTVTVLSKSSVRLSWTGSSGASGYQILLNDGTSTQQLGSVGARTTSVKVTGLNAGATYMFAVTAFNLSGSATSTWVGVTMPALAVLSAPTNVQFSKTSASAGTLSWSAAAGATSYLIYAADQYGRTLDWAQVGADTTSIAVSGLLAGRTYLFRVAAMNADSSASSEWLRVMGQAVVGSSISGNGNGSSVSACGSSASSAFAAFARRRS